MSKPTDEMSERRLLALGVDERLRVLDQISLLRSCSAAERRELAEKAHILAFDEGDLILREGEQGLGFYIVLSGSARVVRRGATINRVGSGGWFGEVALLEGIPRTADVVADERTVCLGLLRSDFRRLLAREPRVGMTIIEEEGRRLLGDPDHFDTPASPGIGARDDAASLLESPGSSGDDDAGTSAPPE